MGHRKQRLEPHPMACECCATALRTVTRKMPLECKHALAMATSNTTVPRLAADCTPAMRNLPRKINQIIFDLAAQEVVPRIFVPPTRGRRAHAFALECDDDDEPPGAAFALSLAQRMRLSA